MTPPCAHSFGWTRRPDDDPNARSLRYVCRTCGIKGEKPLGAGEDAIAPLGEKAAEREGQRQASEFERAREKRDGEDAGYHRRVISPGGVDTKTRRGLA